MDEDITDATNTWSRNLNFSSPDEVLEGSKTVAIGEHGNYIKL